MWWSNVGPEKCPGMNHALSWWLRVNSKYLLFSQLPVCCHRWLKPWVNTRSWATVSAESAGRRGVAEKRWGRRRRRRRKRRRRCLWGKGWLRNSRKTPTWAGDDVTKPSVRHRRTNTNTAAKPRPWRDYLHNQAAVFAVTTDRPCQNKLQLNSNLSVLIIKSPSVSVFAGKKPNSLSKYMKPPNYRRR